MGQGWFASTHWSVVLSAADPSATACQESMEKLCRTYWYPLYAYVRSRGYSPEDAQDLTQEFFRRFIEDRLLQEVQPSKGKFRSFLLACMKNLIQKEWRDRHAQKRGGGRVMVPLDGLEAEERYRLEPAEETTPEKVFDRCWAMCLLNTTATRLRHEYQVSGKATLFVELEGTLSGGGSDSYADIAARLNMSGGAVKVAVHRLRQRYSHLLRAEVANTVDSEAAVDSELRDLLAILTGN